MGEPAMFAYTTALNTLMIPIMAWKRFTRSSKSPKSGTIGRMTVPGDFMFWDIPPNAPRLAIRFWDRLHYP
ncbi:MAG: hypothetical protein Q4D62_02210 [Planctomycetia bacterium]|nr:hypothetical protein [Planctomycetia bacterium]